MTAASFRREEIDGRIILRDDLVPGGTKRRALERFLEPGREYVFGGPCEGFAQVALAIAAAERGARATSVVAARQQRHPNVDAAEAAGAQIIEIRPGRLTNVRARAREYAERAGAFMCPLGFDWPEFRAALAAALVPVGEWNPPEVWCVAGTGCLTRTLQFTFPRARHVAVQIGRPLRPWETGLAALLVAPEQFSAGPEEPPPFPSALNYDAKGWRFFRERAAPGALFWNVAA